MTARAGESWTCSVVNGGVVGMRECERHLRLTREDPRVEERILYAVNESTVGVRGMVLPGRK